MKRFVLRMTAFSLLALSLQVLVSLDWSLGTIRSGSSAQLPFFGKLSVGLPPGNAYRPDPEILHFQRMMTTHPTLGFLYKGNLGQPGSQEAALGEPSGWVMTTDERGFFNLSEAITLRQAGRPIDIAAVGSSFTQGAAGTMHKYFAAKNLFYYNFASPRHTFPQFTVAAVKYAIPQRPRWLLYEVNESGFSLIEDYERWLASGMDWFTYHSGTWCGPPAMGHRSWLSWSPTLDALYQGAAKRMGVSTRPIERTNKGEAVAKAFALIQAAHAAATQQGVGFLVVLIPSRERAAKGESARWEWVESLEDKLRSSSIEVLNLADVFDQDADPRQLYLRVDAHWNDSGMTVAARAILQRLQSNSKHPNAPTSMR